MGRAFARRLPGQLGQTDGHVAAAQNKLDRLGVKNPEISEVARKRQKELRSKAKDLVRT